MTNADKELLTLAARAAGIDTTRCLQYADGAFDWPGKTGRWDPLADDGDALRLAVTLKLDVRFESGGVLPNSAEAVTNRLAATRRAITRAAAEIGRTM